MRNISLLITLLFSMNIFGQQHLNMFGLPLNGSIEVFTSKLAQKGIHIDKEINKLLPVGGRAFKGRFAGYTPNLIMIFYDPQSKVVFKGLVNFEDENEEYLMTIFSDIRKRILEKHSEYLYNDDKNADGLPVFDCTIFKSLESADCIGDIKMSIIKKKFYPYTKLLYITYEDRLNAEKYDKKKSEDL